MALYPHKQSKNITISVTYLALTLIKIAVTSLRSVLSEIYKQYSIHEAIQEHDLLMNDGDFLSKWTQVVKDYCGLLSGRFSDKPANVTSNPTVLVNRYEFCFELSRKENKRLKNTIEASIWRLSVG